MNSIFGLIMSTSGEDFILITRFPAVYENRVFSNLVVVFFKNQPFAADTQYRDSETFLVRESAHLLTRNHIKPVRKDLMSM